jgi:hypothetical protein
MECRSTLGAHLTPFHKKAPILWAIEGTFAPGIISDFDTEPAKIKGGMLIGALDFTFLKKNNIYIEGGYKMWQNSALQNVVQTGTEGKNSRHIGMRQIFYTFNGKTTKIVLGLQEMKLGDYLLIDERVLGMSFNQEVNAFSFNFRTGTVLQNFARMGQFCGNRHLYNIIESTKRNIYTENIGKKPMETNLTGLTINWDPSYTKKPAKTGDKFSEFDEFSNAEDSKEPLISNVGLVLYSEYGKIIPEPKLYIGPMLDFNIPLKIKLQTGAIFQYMKDNNSFVYITKLNRNFMWNSGDHTEIGTAFIGKYNIDKDALFQPLFSNLFLGEIMRLDATDFPLWHASIKHKFSGKLKFHIGLKTVGQIYDNKTQEIDLEAGLKLFNHVKITTIFSQVQSKALPNNTYMGRLELRIAF